MALKVQALRKNGVKISENPENLIGNADYFHELLKTLPSNVVYRTWKKVTLENGKTKMKIVEIECQVESFKEDLKKQLELFDQHVQRVPEQYQHVQRVLEQYQHVQRVPEQYQHVQRVREQYQHVQRVLEQYQHVQRVPEQYQHVQRVREQYQHVQRVREQYQHVQRVREQYQHIRQLKESLPEDEIVVQMDFAEIFSCRSLDEIQTVYWNQSMVTLHPVVAYYKENDKLKHKSFVFISDEMSHSSGTVAAFLDRLISELKEMKPNLKLIHYWTDSPSSQYRNRFILYLIANHRNLYSIGAKWNYFEVGHVKGPCDGLGGTVKRMADEDIRQGNAVTQDAWDFQACGTKSSMTGVRFIHVSSEATKLKQCELNSVKTKPLRNTMKHHAVGITDDPKKLMTRETSCYYCSVCITGSYCDSWTIQNFSWSQLATSPDESTSSVTVSDPPSSTHPSVQSDVAMDPTISENDTSSPAFVGFKKGDFVAAVYDGKWYLGRIEEIDMDDKDCEINFMKQAKGLFKWPD